MFDNLHLFLSVLLSLSAGRLSQLSSATRLSQPVFVTFLFVPLPGRGEYCGALPCADFEDLIGVESVVVTVAVSLWRSARVAFSSAVLWLGRLRLCHGELPVPVGCLFGEALAAVPFVEGLEVLLSECLRARLLTCAMLYLEGTS